MNLMTVGEAAQRLGVSTRQVQHLVAQGELLQVARGVLDQVSVDRYLAVREKTHGRAWSEATAWGAVALLSGVEAGWMGGSQRSRLKARLRTMGPDGLVERARGRALAMRYAGHSSAEKYLAGELARASVGAERFGLAETTRIDGYVAASEVDGVVTRHGLRRDDGGRVTIRATSMRIDVVHELVRRGVVIAALDLAESLEVRERRAGLDVLDQALADFRG